MSDYVCPSCQGTHREGECPSLIAAFIQGAKWWEFQSRGATMWPSDQEAAEAAARVRAEQGTLGKHMLAKESK